MSPEMETEITCPDCGKIIAPAGSVADNRRCRCAELEAQREGSPGAKPSKTCYVCGKNLEGRTRLKDSRGRYWCKSCSEADDRLKQRQSELRCPDCGRLFPDHKLVYFQADRVCNTCFKEREKALERKVAKFGVEKVHKGAEISKLTWMAIVAGGLILLATIFQYFLR